MRNKAPQFTLVTQVRPDAKGRITLSKLAEGVSSYTVSKDEEGRLLLEPMVEMPAREAWLFRNEKALASVKSGLADAKAGKTTKRSFTKYAKEDEE